MSILTEPNAMQELRARCFALAEDLRQRYKINVTIRPYQELFQDGDTHFDLGFVLEDPTGEQEDIQFGVPLPIKGITC